MDDIARKIKELRREMNLSQDQFSRRLGVTKKTIAEWEQSRQLPSPERCLQLGRLAAPAGPLRRWFIRNALKRIGAESRLVLDALQPEPRGGTVPAAAGTPELRVIASADWSQRMRALEGLDHFVPVPLLTDAAAAGAPRAIAEADIEGYALIPYAWCPNPDNFTCLRVRGDSMAPVLHDGAIVAVDHTRRDPLALNQKMVAARYQDGVTIKWLERRSEDTLLLVPENKSHPVLTLPRSPDNPIVGMVAWWWNKQQ